MKLNIKNLHITLSNPHQPSGLIASLAIAAASIAGSKPPSVEVPEVGEKWPGTEATYAGISLSQTGDSLVHLILWDDKPKKGMTYENAVEHASRVSVTTSSHLPTRHQSITLFERLRDQFELDYYHWTLTKTKDGNAAFTQSFDDGNQDSYRLSAECRVRAVSEIHL